MTDNCSYPRCRHPEALTYLGRPLCADHWRALAQSDYGSEQEGEILTAIGVKRRDRLAAQFINPESLTTAAARAIGANQP